MTLAEQVIYLAGTWVSSSFMLGRRKVFECECPPDLKRSKVQELLGDASGISAFTITLVKQTAVIEMMALPIGNSLIVWKARQTAK
ncbi:hypothetical protein [Vibrio sp. OPT18]|uniref:hypothetical protein n=1 Tax=Vibrio sp. OPT18 TaxID=2778641 RepID=UPI001881568F|nr:hypothetical protein [Vibrio sp. OPT18]MBE8578613.1 hypothetical protein [Vibrio sp. OPT18]